MSERSGRWFVVSNRLPFSWDPNNGSLKRSSGGLVTAIMGIHRDEPMHWFGVAPEGLDEQTWQTVTLPENTDLRYQPLFIDDALYDEYYNGMCNGALWPLLHYQSERVQFVDRCWEAYCKVNRAFADAILKEATDDDVVWLHDFHLLLVPQFLREARKRLKIGFFLHTPFPSSEVFKQLPVRTQLLEAVLHADLIGFHDYSYLRHFSSSLSNIVGIETRAFAVERGSSRCQLGVFPVSIDVEHLRTEAASKLVRSEIRKLRRFQSADQIVIGVDRLDYIKGIDLKLRAFHALLEQHPEMRGRVSLIQVTVPSRTGAEGHIDLRQQIEQLVGEINGKFGAPNYTPVQYLYRSVSFAELLALYRHADVLLVTSRRDGMNLVSLEYLASQAGKNPGVIVLSEFAGAVGILSHVIPTNPWDFRQTAENLHQALTMPREEKIDRQRSMMSYLQNYSATDWAETFVKALERRPRSIGSEGTLPLVNPDPTADGSQLNGSGRLNLEPITEKLNGKQALVFLDYDGTLVPIEKSPERAVLGESQREALTKLVSTGTRIVVVSGRDRRFLKRQLEGTQIPFGAEHGARFVDPSGKSKILVRTDRSEWFSAVLETMRAYAKRVPGSMIERKEFSVAWHYRNAPKAFGEFQARKLKWDLEVALSNLPVSILHGKKVIEVRSIEANKGVFAHWYAAEHLSESDRSQMLLIAIGDDQTDEDLFSFVSSAGGISIKVGAEETHAEYRLQEQELVYPLLQALGAS